MTADAQQRWRLRRRRRLIDAAARVFARQGFEAASMDDIAREAGAGKPTLYRYFASKDALFEAVFVDALDTLETRLDEGEQASGDPATTLRAMLHAIVSVFREHVATLRGLSDAATTADRSRRRILSQRRGRIEARIAAVLRRARDAAILRPADPALGARFVIGMIWSGTASADHDDATVVRAVVDLLIDGDAARLHAQPPRRRRDPTAGIMDARGDRR